MKGEHIAFIGNDEELTAFLIRAGVEPEHHKGAKQLFDAMGGLTISNSQTGEYCVGKAIPPMMKEQAI